MCLVGKHPNSYCFSRKALPGFLAYCSRDLVFLGSTFPTGTYCGHQEPPGTMEPVGAPAFLPQGPQGAISWWVLPGLGAKPRATHLGNTSAVFALRHRSCPPLLSGSSARPRSRFHVRNMNFDVKFPLFLLGSASIVSCFTMVVQVLPPAGRTI